MITGTNQDYATWMIYDRADRLLATTYNNANQPVTLRNNGVPTPRVFVTDTLYNTLGQPTKVNLATLE